MVVRELLPAAIQALGENPKRLSDDQALQSASLALRPGDPARGGQCRGERAILAKRRAALCSGCSLDPVALLHTIREAQWARAAMVSPEIRPTPRSESLERFLARLPDRWREEQEHAHREPRVKPPSTWRTRKVPFEGVWCDGLGWLQEDPDASAVGLPGWLQEREPDRFSRAHLRTLERGVQQWRGIMADKLVYAASEASLTDPVGMLGMVPIGNHPHC